MNFNKYFLLVVTIIVYINNLNFNNNERLYTSIAHSDSIFVGIKNNSRNYLLSSQSFLTISLKSNAPSKKSGKKSSKNDGSNRGQGQNTRTFEENMDDLAQKLEKFSISSLSKKVIEVTCLDFISLLNVLIQGIQFLQTLITMIGDFSLLERCLQMLISRSVGKGSTLSKLLSSIKKVSKALESQKSMFKSLLKLLNESESKIASISSLIKKCTMTVSQSLLLGSPRFEDYFGLPEKINSSQKKVTSFDSFVNKIVAEYCNDGFLANIDNEILKLQSKDTVEDMEVS
ncbi:Uncharacterized protein GY17_00001845 [Cryptosporidium hominis]|uniref:Uncharacterized protein n=1 Tax=Cryptosporidium hominis TaxID=237895 RepID=A0ABX5BEJ6_CRYHO|nr:hypothetical protein [Cryptosporidium hominis TU502]PPS96338.1 Uncharacterized protein GY17_00001845 [Cryptosporidium hominis]|eukprot:PPS96338.1 Uncharacterized protein GY17_00001845 [Cryptosporidium hominis]